MPEAPKEWLDLPAEILVDVDLSELTSVTGRSVQEFARDNLTDVLRVVSSPRQAGILFAYCLAAREVIPLLGWNVDWPLSRRGQRQPVKRTTVQGVVPWESHPDSSLLSIYQSVPYVGSASAPSYYTEPTVRLRVGGRTAKEAIKNWHQCAQALRRLKRQIE